MQYHIYNYQRRALRLLLGWGVVNTIAGLPLALSRNEFWRQFGFQAMSWGAIDALLALFGLTSAARNAFRYGLGEIEEQEAAAEARKFHRILWINAGLDLLYISFGLANAGHAQRERRGMGLGIFVQGLFLLIFDTLIARGVASRFLTPETER